MVIRPNERLVLFDHFPGPAREDPRNYKLSFHFGGTEWKLDSLRSWKVKGVPEEVGNVLQSGGKV